MIKTPKPFLKSGIIYSADNGRRICLCCAGMSSLYTGRDISGQKIYAMPVSETVEWRKYFGKDLSCESGCTTYLQPA